jgi:hypothetical protein
MVKNTELVALKFDLKLNRRGSTGSCVAILACAICQLCDTVRYVSCVTLCAMSVV